MSGKLVIEIIDPLDNPTEKFAKGVAALSKATGTHIHLAEESKAEPTPYTALRELGNKVFDEVEAGISEIWLEIQKKWLRTETIKAESIYKLNGKTFLNPKTGKPLTIKQWKVIQKDLERVFGKLYANQQDAMLNQAMAMGKILRNMEPVARITAPLASLGLDVFSQVVSADDEYRNIINWATIHTGELIQEVTNRSRKSIVEMIMQGYQDKVGQRELESRLFDKMSDLNKDWRSIAETETATNFNNGYLQATLEDRDDEEEPVFMLGISGAGACDFCRTHVDGQVVVLLKEAPGSGEIVTVDGREYVAIWCGKNNYGRKRADWWVSAGTQHPHTYAKDTEVFTDQGWKLFPDLAPSDEIMALDPETREIGFVRYVRFIKHHQGTMIRLSGRNFDLMVTPEHRQLELSRKTGKLMERSIADLIQKEDFSLPRAIGEWEGEYTPEYGLSEETYARLWAWFLSDGCAGKYGTNFQVCIPQKDNLDIKKDLGDLISASGYVHTSVKALFKDYVKIRAWDKWIPDKVKNLSQSALRAFIETYSHADGHNRKGKMAHSSSYQGIRGESVTLFTSSKRLMNDLSEVIVKAGFLPSFYIQRPSGKLLSFPNGQYQTKRDVYVLGVCKSQYRRFSRSMNVGKIHEVEYNDVAYDVELEKWHHLLVRRNGKVAWSGNCRCTWTEYDMRIAAYEKKLRAAAGS